MTDTITLSKLARAARAAQTRLDEAVAEHVAAARAFEEAHQPDITVPPQNSHEGVRLTTAANARLSAVRDQHKELGAFHAAATPDVVLALIEAQ